MARAKTDEAVFQWIEGEPPPEPERSRRGQVGFVLEKVNERPGHWARITGPYKEPTYARNMVKSWSKKYPAFEFLARPGTDDENDKLFYVYAKKVKSGTRLRVTGGGT